MSPRRLTMRQFRAPAFCESRACVRCSAELNVATSVDHENAPTVGDLTICGFCGQVYELAAGAPLALRPLTWELVDPREVGADQYKQLAHLRQRIAARGAN